MTREKKIGLGVLTGAAMALVILLGIALAHQINSLYVTVVFDDAKGLQKGDRVQLNGVNIGAVKWVQLHSQPTRVDVRIKIPPREAEKVRSDATAIIRGVSFPNVSGQRVVEIVNPDSSPPAPPMRGDSVIYGMNSELELAAWKLKHVLSDGGTRVERLVQTMSENVGRLRDEIKQIATSPQVQEAIQQLRQFMEKMQDQGRQAVDQLKQEWPRLQEKMAPVLRELHDFGRDYIVRQLEQLMRQIEDTLNRWQREAIHPTTSPAATKEP